MKIAAIVITYNDGYKISEWLEHHLEYQDELYMHIIVDNHSDPEYLKMVEKSFPKSVLIQRKTNGGCTAAYNDGIRYALQDPEVDAILLIANDIRLEKGGLTKLYHFLMGNKQYGMVSPVLLGNGSDSICDFGCTITKSLSMKTKNLGDHVDEVAESIHQAEALTGGMNLSKREFYEQVGLQDENLFMYSDEVDMGLRAKKLGWLLACTKEVKSWHCHVNANTQSNIRHPFTSYLIGRNKVYLAKKHFGFFRTVYVFIVYKCKCLVGILTSILKGNKYLFKQNLWLFWGLVNGLFGNMKSNKYSHPNTEIRKI